MQSCKMSGRAYWCKNFLSYVKGESALNLLPSDLFLLIYVHSEIFNVLCKGKE